MTSQGMIRKVLIFNLMIVNCISGFKPNVLLNLTKISGNEKNLTFTFVYNLVFLGEELPFLSKITDEIVYLKHVRKSMENKALVNSDNSFIFKNYILNQSEDMSFRKNIYKICWNFHIIQEFNIDIILNKLFSCQHPVEGYISKFYGSKTTRKNLHKVKVNNVDYYISYYKNFSFFWLVSNRKSHILKNQRNYREFLKDCNKSHNQILMILPGAVTFFTLLFIVLLILLKIKNLENNPYHSNPIIMVRPAREIQNY